MKTAWEKYNGKFDEIMDFSEGYKKYLDSSKTEREACRSAVALAKKKGFKDGNTVKSLKAGDKIYYVNRDKAVCMFVIGKEKLEKGMNVLGAHIDSPRVDLKQVPVYEEAGLVLLDTHYYGGIKKYQWVTHPMALHGVVCKKDGSVLNISIGEKDDEPVIEFSDLLIHLAQDQMQKTGAKVVEGEDLNALCGSIPSNTKKEERELVKKNILSILKKEYNIEEDDFISAELEIVPAGHARDLGLDRSMVMAYGQDDRICAYTSLEAFLEVTSPKRTTCCLLVDKEEVGSQGSTGMKSKFFEYKLAEVLEKVGEKGNLVLNNCLSNSIMLSSDVHSAFDPNYPQVFERKNCAYLGKGICFTKYGGSRGKSGSNDAHPELIAKIRKIMDDNNISFQTGELGKVDVGGGGTIAYITADLNMEVIDAGIPIQNMHACYETASKVDIFEGYKAYKAFLKEMK